MVLRERLLQWMFPPACPFCDTPTGRAQNEACEECRGGIRPRSLEDRAWLLLEDAPALPVFCGLEYLPPIPQAIRMLKFHQGLLRAPGLVQTALPPFLELLQRLQEGWVPCGDSLGVLQWKHWTVPLTPGQFTLWPRTEEGLPCSIEALVPIPLHPKRFRQRGYNQAEELAKSLSSYVGIPVLPQVLVRQRYTERQTELHKDWERVQNVRGAFCCSEDFVQWLPNRTVLLIDDVLTTGSSWLEAASVLEKAGAHVVGWILASNHAGWRSLYGQSALVS